MVDANSEQNAEKKLEDWLLRNSGDVAKKIEKLRKSSLAKRTGVDEPLHDGTEEVIKSNKSLNYTDINKQADTG